MAEKPGDAVLARQDSHRRGDPRRGRRAPAAAYVRDQEIQETIGTTGRRRWATAGPGLASGDTPVVRVEARMAGPGDASGWCPAWYAASVPFSVSEYGARCGFSFSS